MNENHKHLTLEQAEYWARQGLMSDAEWLAYKHAWQIGAPRFGPRVCQCQDCRKSFPNDWEIELCRCCQENEADPDGDYQGCCGPSCQAEFLQEQADFQKED